MSSKENHSLLGNTSHGSLNFLASNSRRRDPLHPNKRKTKKRRMKKRKTRKSKRRRSWMPRKRRTKRKRSVKRKKKFRERKKNANNEEMKQLSKV